jgi:NADPH:quinone reductase-like Zn-dependent oxidoreductase
MKVGSDVDSTKPGDRIAVIRAGKTATDARFGAYQKYPLALEANTAKLGPGVKLDNASGVITSLATVVSVLSLYMGLQRPPLIGKAKVNGKRLLVYGGPSNVGGLAVKYASDAGYTVITTSSPKNKLFVATRCPEYIVNHTETSEKVISELKTHGPYDAIFDAIGTPAATAIIGGLLAETGGVYYSTLASGEGDKLLGNVEKRFAIYTGKISDPANQHIKKWYMEEYLPQGLSNGNIFPNRILKLEGGLSSVQEALDRLFSSSASGVKIVVNPQE